MEYQMAHQEFGDRTMKKTFVAAALLVALLAILPSNVHAQQCSNAYTAKRGDSWWSIAQSANTTLIKIFKINNATAKTQILVGDNICIPAVAPVPQSLSRGQVIQIIRAAWPDELEEQAIAIAQRESRLNPRAVSSGKCCYGLFQIYYRWHKTWLPDVGVTTANQLLDAQLNAVAAYRMYQRNNGWGPWK
jgi:hypothetical protein